MNVSVVIVSYNVRELLMTCISTLKQYWPSGYGCEIIVVDNNSADGTVAALKENHPDVKVVASTKNLGFSNGNNLGVNMVTSEYVFLLNPDTELFDHSILHLFELIKSKPDKCIVAPRLLNSDRTIQRSLIKYPGVTQMFGEMFYLSKMLPSFNMYAENYQQPSPVEAISGAALCMKRELYVNLKGLDENLFWMEDVDLCMRNQMEGGVNLYDPVAVIIHHSGRSSTKSYTLVIANQLLSKIKFVRKHYSIWQILAIWLVCNLHMLTRIIVFLIIGIFKLDYLSRSLSYVKCLGIVNKKFLTSDLTIYI